MFRLQSVTYSTDRRGIKRVNLSLANILVGAKHDRCKSLAIANKFSAVMREPMQNRDALNKARHSWDFKYRPI
ncbi:hypothetical protein [Microcoleus sp.]|uniref:hypothetical protein n=1 Tax=Microcoleus sp. TaxID=44472 RepID=UPI0035258888